ncbi:acetyltransferase [Oscillospiraceae bacterium N12]|jgi:NDP-sugar pyrophosphorylase family protein|uniref:Acetyltransferase n=1 Tax=Jilunia laotingensis TaxID=2763675 RepID=A0A926FAJ1_9BACT|nr:acetyltransferase [Jilunia laotingensis]MBC8594805.1 acetyltransferase [Jilunia laotingensis]
METKKIIFFGTGAVSAEFTSYLEDSKWGEDSNIEIKGYVASDQDGIKNWRMYGYSKPFLGLLSEYEIQEEDYFILALGNAKVKRGIVDIISSKGGKFLNLIHPTSTIAKTATLGIGNIVSPFVMIGPNVKIGNFNLLTSQSIVSHDSVVGDYNFFATALLCGHTTVGDDNYMGIRATTVPEISIGDRNKIQAGMILDKNVGDDSTVFYRYKEKLLAIPQ